MKKIILPLVAFSLCAFFASCADTKDCVCEVEGVETTVADWDGACSDITESDVPDLGSNPCSEL
ncbi:MAG: hypothetical protein HUK18_06865 [Bacteroidales bacterium]|nr:hypothetical protein [Bacteroidales bacterium]